LFLNIRKKIAISFTFFILTSTLVWSLNLYNHYQLTKKIKLIDEKIELLNTVLECRRYEKNYFLYFNRTDLREAITYASNAEKKQADIIDKYKEAVRHLPLRGHLKNLKQYKALLTDLLNTDAGKHREKLLQKQIRTIGKQITDNIESIVSNEREKIRGLIYKTNLYLYGALIAIFVITAITVIFIALNVNAPLKSIEIAIHKIAKGDYSSIPPVSTGDIFESLVNSLNRMIEVLNRRNEQLIHSEKLASLGTLTSGEETENQIDRARDIIKGLLEFSRERRFVPRKVNFKKLVEKTMKLIKGEIPSNVTQHFRLDDSLEVRIGPHQIQRVIMNLVINAAHAMENGGGEMTITAERTDENTFCFQVRDTGEGIRKEDMERIFDPFYTTKEVGKGTGLGLSISHGIIESHGGRMEVESQEGMGTVFKVSLPLLCEIPEISRN